MCIVITAKIVFIIPNIAVEDVEEWIVISQRFPMQQVHVQRSNYWF